jgi:hypothetical protein
MSNITVLSLSAGCPLDFDYNIHMEEVFQEHLVGQLAILPGALFSALAINKLGRVKIIGKLGTDHNENIRDILLVVSIVITKTSITKNI